MESQQDGLGLEYGLYKEQLRELCLFNLYRRMLRGDHSTILNYLKTEPELLENAQQNDKRGNECKLKKVKFRLDKRNKKSPQ